MGHSCTSYIMYEPKEEAGTETQKVLQEIMKIHMLISYCSDMISSFQLNQFIIGGHSWNYFFRTRDMGKAWGRRNTIEFRPTKGNRVFIVNQEFKRCMLFRSEGRVLNVNTPRPKGVRDLPRSHSIARKMMAWASCFSSLSCSLTPQHHSVTLKGSMCLWALHFSQGKGNQESYALPFKLLLQSNN